MEFMIKGRNVTEQVDHAENQLEILYLFEQFKDRSPIGDEQEQHWMKRNNNLLAAMLLTLARNQLLDHGKDEYGDTLTNHSIEQREVALTDSLGVEELPATFHY